MEFGWNRDSIWMRCGGINLLLEENSDFPYFESDGPLCAMNS